MPVRTMLAQMDSRELAYWRAFDEINPIGEWRADLRSGIVAATIMNSQRASRTAPIAKASDFMPKFDVQPLSPAEEAAALKALIRGAAPPALPRSS